jgi:hypothetical protein
MPAAVFRSLSRPYPKEHHTQTTAKHISAVWNNPTRFKFQKKTNFKRANQQSLKFTFL